MWYKSMSMPKKVKKDVLASKVVIRIKEFIDVSLLSCM
jgi:hypothetical protein